MLIYLQMIETEEDRSKFEEIYDSYRNLMFYVANKRLHHAEDSEDVVHHVFMKIAENIKTIEPASPRTLQYVVTMVDNRVTDLFRAKGRHPEAPFMEALETSSSFDLDSSNLLAECILRLPEQQQTVIILKYHYGYSLREIAKMLDITLVWAQKIDQRAKKKLAELYQEEGGHL